MLFLLYKVVSIGKLLRTTSDPFKEIVANDVIIVFLQTYPLDRRLWLVEIIQVSSYDANFLLNCLTDLYALKKHNFLDKVTIRSLRPSFKSILPKITDSTMPNSFQSLYLQTAKSLQIIDQQGWTRTYIELSQKSSHRSSNENIGKINLEINSREWLCYSLWMNVARQVTSEERHKNIYKMLKGVRLNKRFHLQMESLNRKMNLPQ